MTHRGIAFAVLLLGGCYLGHGADEPPPTEPPPTEPPPTEPPPTEPPPTEPPPVGPTCGVVDGHVLVHYEDLPPAPDTGQCRRDDGSVYGVLESVEPVDEIDGIRLTLDGCPGGFAPCPCAIRVEGVGVDMALRIANVGAIVTGTIGERHLSLRVDYACDACVGCPCPRPWVVVHAAEGELFLPGTAPSWAAAPPVPVTPGAATCSIRLDPEDSCAGDLYRRELDVQATADGPLLFSADEGQTVGTITEDDGFGRSSYLALRNLRSTGLIPGCADIDVPFEPAYVLWEEPVYMADDGAVDTHP